MKSKNVFKFIFVIIAIAILVSCDEAGEWYLGFHKQPEFFDGMEYSKAINVFGVIRPDMANGEQQSFIRVEKTTSSKSIELGDSITLTNANVYVTYFDNNLNEQKLKFNFQESDTSYLPDVFQSNDINVEAGKTYFLECSDQGYDTVYASTTVPNIPNIKSVTKIENSIVIEIQPDESAHLYEAVYFSFSSGYVEPKNGITTIEIQLDAGIPGNSMVHIYAYDKNLAEYFADVTSSILNLNSYRAPYTTVNGGYGCFGSLNFVGVLVE